MDIAVIGAGRVGATLGQRWDQGGHSVTFGVRDPADARHAELGTVRHPAAAVDGADIVLLALPWDAVEQVVHDLPIGDAVLIDATNPLATDPGALDDRPAHSGAELIASWTGSRRVVKAFNTTGSGNQADATYPAGRPLMPVAGDDDDAKAVVVSLAEELGFEGVDAGPLRAAADLEHLAALWIRLAYPLGHGPNVAFALLRR